MIGKSGTNVGSLHVLPAPSSTVLNQALSLLATFGDSKGLKETLSKMVEVQKSNEETYKQAQEELANIRREREALSKEIDDFNKKKSIDIDDISRRVREVSEQAARISGMATKLSAEAKERNEAMANREQECAYKEKDLKDTAKKLDEKAHLLSVKEKEIEAANIALAERQASLQAREAKLRSYLNG